MDTAQLDVTVAPGLVDSEYYVMVNDGPSAYVDRRQVAVSNPPAPGSEVRGKVTVYVLDRSANDVLVEIPGEAVIGGLRARVPNALVTG